MLFFLLALAYLSDDDDYHRCDGVQGSVALGHQQGIPHTVAVIEQKPHQVLLLFLALAYLSDGDDYHRCGGVQGSVALRHQQGIPHTVAVIKQQTSSSALPPPRTRMSL